MLKNFLPCVLFVVCVTCFVCTSANASRISGITAHVWPDERTGGQSPSKAVDGDLNTYTWSTRSHTNRPNHLGFDFGKMEYVNRIRLWKTNYGDWNAIVPKNLTIQYTSDLEPMSSRQWFNVPNLTNGFGDIEILRANAVNPDGTVQYDNHDSRQHGWASLMFCPVEATGIRITFSNAKSYPFVHYRVYEVEILYDGDISDGLIVYWPFNGNADDASENGRNGIVRGATLISDLDGIPNSAYFFDGENDHIAVSHSPAINPEGSMWTVSAWVNLLADGSVVYKSEWSTGGDNMDLRMSAGKASFNILTCSGSSATAVSETSINDGTWHHIAGVRDGLRSVKIYVDGILEGADSFSGGCSSIDTAYPLYIGRSITGNYVEGFIDEVRIYNRALSSDEMVLLMYPLPCDQLALGTIIYVNDDALSDPAPMDSTISDLEEDGSEEHPFDMIQEGIEAAQDGDTVVVFDGTYWENIDFDGKSIRVTGLESNLPGDSIKSFPVVDGNGQGPVVSFMNGEDPNTELSGFVITGGLSDTGSAIQCIGSHPLISNCLIAGNRVNNHLAGSTVYCEDSNNAFANCTIADNYTGQYGTNIYLEDSNSIISNCIVRGYTQDQILVMSGNDPIVAYSNIQGTWPGTGNIDIDPSFSDQGYWANSTDPSLLPREPNEPGVIWLPGDYHLLSRVGRWNPITEFWVLDDFTSPCIDKGDPAYSWYYEPEPHGDRINMGAYGGTSQASMSPEDCCLTVTSGMGGRVIVAPGTDKEGVVDPGETETFCFDCGEVVTLVAEVDPYYHVPDWTPDDLNRCSTTVLVDGDTAVTVTRERNDVNVGSETGGGGHVELPNGERSEYDRNKPVRVIAKPDPCYHFVDWTGTAVEKGKVVPLDSNDTWVTVDADYTLIANFASNGPNDLTISSSDGGSVTNPGEGTFPGACGRDVPVTATAEPCYHFTHWTGTAVDSGKVTEPNEADTTVLVDGDYSLIANFDVDVYELTISSGDGGSVTDPGEEAFPYDCGTLVPITAMPDEGYKFVSWSGSAMTAGQVADALLASTTVTMDANYTLVANFELDPILKVETWLVLPEAITTSSVVLRGYILDDAGDSTCSVSFSYFKEADGFTQGVFTPEQQVMTVDGTGESTLPIEGLDPNCAYRYQACVRNSKGKDMGQYIAFTTQAVGQDHRTLIVSSTDGGSVTVPGEGARQYGHATSVAVTAVSENGYYFVNWSGSAVTAGKVADVMFESTTVRMDWDYTLVANFEQYSSFGVASRPVLLNDITASSVVLRGRILDDAGDSNCTVGFRYFKKSDGPAQGVLTEDQPLKTVDGKGEFSLPLKGLEPNCTYRYQAHARNSKGNDKGQYIEFTTKAN